MDRSQPDRRTDSAPTLRSEFADDPDMGELVAEFVEELGARIGAIRAAFETDDSARLRTIAHQLKGAAGGYGFPTIGLAAGDLERAIGAEAHEVRNKVEELVQLCRSAIPADRARAA